MKVLSFHSDAHRGTPVDLLVEEPFDFDDEYRSALRLEIAPGILLRVLRLEALLRMNADAGRPQDLVDAAELAETAARVRAAALRASAEHSLPHTTGAG